MRIIELHEREARVFPRDALVGPQGQSLVLPETRDLFAVELRDVASGVELRARGLVGYLPLTSSITLNIRPKFPVGNLWEMLEIADETYDRVLRILRAYESNNGSAPHHMLARAFCHYLRGILDGAVARGYYREEHKGHYRPKVNFAATMNKYLSRGDDVRVVADTFAFSANLYVNRILKAGCLAFLGVIPRSDQWRVERILLLDALNALHLVDSEKMGAGDQNIAWSLPVWVRDGYYGALTVCAILMGHTKVGFAYEAQGCKLPSFLFSLDGVFECFVRNSLREAFSDHGVYVLDGNVSRHQRPLFRDRNGYPVKPDLIFEAGHKIVGLGEIKYKPKLDECDRYQLISHALSLDAPIGVWISPIADGDGRLEYVGTMANGCEFYHYLLNISGVLKDACATMAKEVKALLKVERNNSP